ncbi:PIN domain-containing protein [Spirochaetota bacterium]
MTLVDTSVWVSFFKGEKNALALKNIIVEGNVIIHPYILGELLLAGLSKTNEDLMKSLNFCNIIKENDIYEFIKKYEAYTYGMGWVDINLAASIFANSYELFSFDSNLQKISKKLGCPVYSG